MKLLENTVLDSLGYYIYQNALDCSLDVKLESFSCKMVSTDKREWKRSMKCPTKGNELQPLSPPEEDGKTWHPYSLSVSPLTNVNSRRLRHASEPGLSGSDEENGGSLIVGAVSRRTLFDLGAVLNLSYPDYDFSQTKSASFTLWKYPDVVQNVNGKLYATVANYGNIRDDLWKAIDDAVKVDDCVIYSYIPAYNCDPFTEDGCIWSFNFLFRNQGLKRFLIFACRAVRSENLDVSAEQLWVVDN